MKSERAQEIVEEMLKILSGRKGFNGWWHEIEDECQDDIRITMTLALMEMTQEESK